jgi:hypothetical protein
LNLFVFGGTLPENTPAAIHILPDRECLFQKHSGLYDHQTLAAGFLSDPKINKNKLAEIARR